MKIFTFDQVTSTQDLARAYLNKHHASAAFVADSQTNSYGKLGRKFYAPPQTGVYFSQSGMAVRKCSSSFLHGRAGVAERHELGRVRTEHT